MFEQILPSVMRMHGKSDDFLMNAQMEINARLPEGITPKIWVEEWLGKLEDVQVSICNEGIQAYKADKHSTLARAFFG